jgi:hypothetical protein
MVAISMGGAASLKLADLDNVGTSFARFGTAAGHLRPGAQLTQTSQQQLAGALDLLRVLRFEGGAEVDQGFI